MTLFCQSARCYLSVNGDSFTVKPCNCGKRGHEPAFQETDPIYPFLTEMEQCKTHESVLALLKQIHKDENRIVMPHFYHADNAAFDGHCEMRAYKYIFFGPLVPFYKIYFPFHRCSIPNMIRFVQEHIDLFSLQSRQKVSEYLDDVKAKGGVNFWGKRVVRYGNSVIDLKKLHKHIEALPEDDGQSDPVGRLVSYAIDAKGACATRNIFTKFLFWIRNG